MALHSLAPEQFRVRSLAQAARVTGGSPYNGTGIDLQGVVADKIDFEIEAWTDGTHALKLQESSDNSTFTDVAAADQQGALTSVTASGGQNTTQSVGYIGKLRYIRPVITSSGTTTGCVIGVSAQVRRRKQ